MGLLRLAALLVLLLASCGDPPLCPSGVFVAIQTSEIATDVDAVAAGVQADIRVRTSLAAGELVTLEVLDQDGAVVMTIEREVDERGAVAFASTTVPTPVTTLRATARGLCGQDRDEVMIDVLAGADCALALSPSPEDNAYYAPLGVLSTHTDPDPSTPGHELEIAVHSRSGWTIELFERAGGAEQAVGTLPVGPEGAARFARTAHDGQVTYRAACRGPAQVEVASASTTVLVDTTPPTCAFASPAPGTTITPALDQNGDLSDGVQLAIDAWIGGLDVEGEPAAVAIAPSGGSPSNVPMSAISPDGHATGTATLAPPATPASYQLSLTARDHAGNTCAATHDYDVVYDGCAIAIASPTAPVTADANGVPGDGSQVDIALQVDPACVGRTVTSTCGTDSPSGVVPASGALTLRATVCATSPCEIAAPCAFHVTNGAGISTTASTTIAFDDQGPAVHLAVVAPPLACGAQITPASDADPATDGVQVVARVDAPGASSRQLEVTNVHGGATLDAAADVAVTLAPGVNRLVGVGHDALGNRGETAACEVALADLSVSFSPPAADGTLSRTEGTVTGNALSLALCGTVNRTGAVVQLAIDGGAPAPATVTGTAWCRPVTLIEGTHTLVATATVGSSVGVGTLVVRVDLTAPPPVLDFTALALDRRRVALAWRSPSDGGQRVAAYVARYATTLLTEASFDTTGTPLALAAPHPPGAAEAAELAPVRTGVALWIGIATLDAAGNRSPARIVGPIAPGFDRSGAITAPDPSLGALSLGYAIAHGKFDDDEYEDLAISAPGQTVNGQLRGGAVYIYFGGPSLIPPAPSLVISSPVANGRFGSGLATVRWSSATRDDLVIGAPGVDGGNGHVYVFRGGAAFPSGAVAASAASAHLVVSAAAPGWFVGSALGSSLAAGDIDGDGTLDLVASAPTGGGGAGGVLIVYGGTAPSSVQLSDIDPSGAGGAIAELIRDPGVVPGRQFGFYVHAVGPTEGALDPTDDLVVAYADNHDVVGESVFVLRGDGTRPTSAGVSPRAFMPGRDVRIDFANAVYRATELGAHVVSIEDQNGDGARDLVVSAYAMYNGGGQVLILDGNAMGTAGIASTSDPGVTLTAITGTSGSRFGAFVLAHDDRTSPDIDGDGREDLMIGGAPNNVGRAFVWFGGAIPTGAVNVSTAHVALDAPPSMTFARQLPNGPAGQARWLGDLDGDGLDDLCWASPFDNGGDGSFEILAD